MLRVTYKEGLGDWEPNQPLRTDPRFWIKGATRDILRRPGEDTGFRKGGGGGGGGPGNS